MSEITLDKVTKRFPDGTEAVKELDLEIADGEFLILVGPSGCGKSTALRMIAGLEDISDGEMRIGDDVVNGKAPKDRDIAMVFQNYALYPHMTVRENMAFPLKMAKMDQSKIDELVDNAATDPRPDRAPRPQALEPLRRPAPAGRDGPGDRPRAERLPDGRAALQPRREAARADARRGLADPEPARDDDRLRHPRPDRGDDARRPGRGDAQGRAAAGRLTAGALRHAGQPVRRRLHRLAVDELHAGRDQRRQGEAAVRRGRSAGGDAAGARLAQRDEPARRDPARALRGRLARPRPAGADLRGRTSSCSSRWARSSTSTSTSNTTSSCAPSSSTSSPPTPAPRSAATSGASQVVARLDAESERARGEKLELWMDASRLHFFDLDSGERIGSDSTRARRGRSGSTRERPARGPRGRPTSDRERPLDGASPQLVGSGASSM